VQEISDMLGGRISNQDEEEVEDELAALEAEMSGVAEDMPSVPNAQLPLSQRESEQPQAERRKQQAMLAS
jgi:charged multivesicular body protein 6